MLTPRGEEEAVREIVKSSSWNKKFTMKYSDKRQRLFILSDVVKEAKDKICDMNPNIEVQLEAANMMKEFILDDYYKNHPEEKPIDPWPYIANFILGLFIGGITIYSILR